MHACMKIAAVIACRQALWRERVAWCCPRGRVRGSGESILLCMCMCMCNGQGTHHCPARQRRDVVNVEDLVVQTEEVRTLSGTARHELRDEDTVLPRGRVRDVRSPRFRGRRPEPQSKPGDDDASISVRRSHRHGCHRVGLYSWRGCVKQSCTSYVDHTLPPGSTPLR